MILLKIGQRVHLRGYDRNAAFEIVPDFAGSKSHILGPVAQHLHRIGCNPDFRRRDHFVQLQIGDRCSGETQPAVVRQFFFHIEKIRVIGDGKAGMEHENIAGIPFRSGKRKFTAAEPAPEPAGMQNYRLVRGDAEFPGEIRRMLPVHIGV